jgi:hypothetical protein
VRKKEKKNCFSLCDEIDDKEGQSENEDGMMRLMGNVRAKFPKLSAAPDLNVTPPGIGPSIRKGVKNQKGENGGNRGEGEVRKKRKEGK